MPKLLQNNQLNLSDFIINVQKFCCKISFCALQVFFQANMWISRCITANIYLNFYLKFDNCPAYMADLIGVFNISTVLSTFGELLKAIPSEQAQHSALFSLHTTGFLLAKT